MKNSGNIWISAGTSVKSVLIITLAVTLLQNSKMVTTSLVVLITTNSAVHSPLLRMNFVYTVSQKRAQIYRCSLLAIGYM